MSPGTDLTGVDFLWLIAPVVLVLFGWIAWVLWADTHPNVRHTAPPSAGYEHISYARTDEDAFAAESSMAMSAADEEPAGAPAAAGATAGVGARGSSTASVGQPEGQAAGQSTARRGPESR
jgi:hypothetical protein